MNNMQVKNVATPKEKKQALAFCKATFKAIDAYELLPSMLDATIYFAQLESSLRANNDVIKILCGENNKLKTDLLIAVFSCINKGLLPDGKEVSIIPYKDKNKEYKKIDIITNKKGYQILAQRRNIYVEVDLVFKEQPAEIYRNEAGKLIVNPDFRWRPQDHIKMINGELWAYDHACLNDYWDNIDFVYAVANQDNKLIKTEKMDIQEIKICSKHQFSTIDVEIAQTKKGYTDDNNKWISCTVWESYPKRMIEKTIIRRICEELGVIHDMSTIVRETSETQVELTDSLREEKLLAMLPPKEKRDLSALEDFALGSFEEIDELKALEGKLMPYLADLSEEEHKELEELSKKEESTDYQEKLKMLLMQFEGK